MTAARNGLKLAAGSLALAAVRAALGRLREDDLTGQTVFVTGGSRGLGLLLAQEFGREGCRVVICAREEGELERARAELERTGVEVLALASDVGERVEVERAMDEATRHFGRIDILVNNAGIIQVGSLQETSASDFEEAHRVIFWGTLNPTLAVLPQMLARGSGRIVNVTSIGGRVSVPHLVPYSSAKFATVGLSEGLRAELRRYGITVTTIAPGLMRTGSYLNAEFKEPRAPEFTWFALGASLPIVSLDARRAARQIVSATRRGDADRTLGIPAMLSARFHGLFPGATADFLGLVNRVLPEPRTPETISPSATMRGAEVEERMASRAVDVATTMGRAAADRTNERGVARLEDDEPAPPREG